MLDKLKKILFDTTGLNIDITLDMSLKNDLGLNSLDLAELVCVVEEEFDIEIPDRAIRELKTVGDVIHFIENNEVV